MEVRTERYEFSHGRKPRGNGYWFFEDRDFRWSVCVRGMYSQAKKIAIKMAKEAGLHTIYVSP